MSFLRKVNIADNSIKDASMVCFYENLIQKFPIVSIEDPMNEED